MQDQQIRIILSASAEGFPAAASAAATGLDKVATASGRASTQLQRTVSEAAKAQRQLAMVGPQITDIFSGLATGQSPLTVLLQQGGQLKDLFGGIGPAARALGAGVASMITPWTLAAAGVTAYVASAVSAYNESNRLRDALALSGGAAAITEGQFDALAVRIAEASGVTVGTARDLALGMVQSGKVSGAALESMGTAAGRMSKVTGQSADSVLTDMLDMTNGVVAWATKHNEQWHFATAAQIDYIRKLEESGNKQAAMVEAGTLLNRHLAAQRGELSLLERAWESVGNYASEAWRGMFGLKNLAGAFGADSAETQVAKIRARLDEWTKASPVYRGTPAAQNEIAGLQAQLATLNRDMLRTQEVGSTAAARVAAEQATIQRRKELTDVTMRLSGANEQYTKDLKAIQAAAAAGDITEEQRLQLLTQAAVRYGPSAAKTGTGESAAAKAEREYQAMVRSTLANRAPSFAGIEAAGYEAANRAAAENMAATAEDIRKRTKAADDYSLTIVEQTRQMNIDLITSDRDRSLAQIELDRQTMQARIDVWAAGGGDVSAAQSALNDNILARQRQLTEQLKPEWERMLDGWKDTTRLMADTYNTAMGRMVSEGESQWVSLVKDGKFSIKSLIDIVIEEQARLQYRQFVAPTLSKAFGQGLNMMGISNGASSSSAGSSADSWEGELATLTGTVSRANAAAGENADMFRILTSGLGAFGNVLQTAAQAVVTLAASAGGSSGGGLLGSIFSLFGGSSGGSGNLLLPDMGASTVGMSLAVGANRIPYDGFRATLHKDEAVVPAAFNPWAGGQGMGGGGGGVTIINHNTFSGGSGGASDRAYIDQQLDRRDAQLKAQFTEQLARRGTGAFNAARS
jgi:hypothetical protein